MEDWIWNIWETKHRQFTNTPFQIYKQQHGEEIGDAPSVPQDTPPGWCPHAWQGKSLLSTKQLFHCSAMLLREVSALGYCTATGQKKMGKKKRTSQRAQPWAPAGAWCFLGFCLCEHTADKQKLSSLLSWRDMWAFCSPWGSLTQNERSEKHQLFGNFIYKLNKYTNNKYNCVLKCKILLVSRLQKLLSFHISSILKARSGLALLRFRSFYFWHLGFANKIFQTSPVFISL